MLPWLLAGANILGGIVQGNINRDVATKQLGATQTAFGQAKGLLDTSIGAYDPYAQAGTAALKSYQDLLSGQSAGSFANNPAFQYQQQLLNQRLAKTRQSAGASAQGVYSAPLIAQEYSNTLSRLMPLISGGMSATGAQAGLRGNLANLYMGQGQTEANAYKAMAPDVQGMVGNAIGAFTGVQNALTNQNYVNTLASLYTGKSGGATGPVIPTVTSGWAAPASFGPIDPANYQLDIFGNPSIKPQYPWGKD